MKTGRWKSCLNHRNCDENMNLFLKKSCWGKENADIPLPWLFWNVHHFAIWRQSDQTHSNMTRVLRWWPDPAYLHPTSTATLFTCHKSSWQQCSHLQKHGKITWKSIRSLRFRYSSTAKWKMMSGTSDFNIRAEAKLRRPACAVRASCTMVRTAVFTGRKKAMGMTIVTRLCLGAILATWFDTWAVSCLHLRRTLGAALCSVAKTLNYANQANKIRKLLLRALHAIWAAKAKGILKAHKRPSLNWCGRMWKVSFCWQTYCRQWWPVRQLSSSTVRRSVSWAKKLPASPGLLQYKNP